MIAELHLEKKTIESRKNLKRFLFEKSTLFILSRNYFGDQFDLKYADMTPEEDVDILPITFLNHLISLPLEEYHHDLVHHYLLDQRLQSQHQDLFLLSIHSLSNYDDLLELGAFIRLTQKDTVLTKEIASHLYHNQRKKLEVLMSKTVFLTQDADEAETPTLKKIRSKQNLVYCLSLLAGKIKPDLA